MRYDKILVLHNGEVVEFDTPAALLARRGSTYSAMVAEAGLTEKSFLTLGLKGR